jgi:hypothetical protein
MNDHMVDGLIRTLQWKEDIRNKSYIFVIVWLGRERGREGERERGGGEERDERRTRKRGRRARRTTRAKKSVQRKQQRATRGSGKQERRTSSPISLSWPTRQHELFRYCVHVLNAYGILRGSLCDRTHTSSKSSSAETRAGASTAERHHKSASKGSARATAMCEATRTPNRDENLSSQCAAQVKGGNFQAFDQILISTVC